MRPQEKAKELHKKFYDFSGEWIESVSYALIAVDEIIAACEYNHVESHNTDWWNKVKEEIKNI